MWHRAVTFSLACLLAGWLADAPPARAQAPAISDSECQTLRQRLGDHARLSAGVRRAVASRVAAAPSASPSTSAERPVAGSGDAIRTRLTEIAAQRDALETQRLGALMKFDLSQASQVQGKIQALDTEKANLERQLASAPAAAPTAPTTSPTTVAATDDASRVPCQDVRATFDSALRIRQRELGAREGQANVVPLVTFKGQSSDEIARELAAQLPVSAGTTTLGLLDVDGDTRIDGVVDEPAEIAAYGPRAESPSETVTCSSGMPSSSAAICAIAVRVPVPMSCIAVMTATRPSEPTRVHAYDGGPPPPYQICDAIATPRFTVSVERARTSCRRSQCGSARR